MKSQLYFLYNAPNVLYNIQDTITTRITETHENPLGLQRIYYLKALLSNYKII